jgi:hypothetical protein
MPGPFTAPPSGEERHPNKRSIGIDTIVPPKALLRSKAMIEAPGCCAEDEQKTG